MSSVTQPSKLLQQKGMMYGEYVNYQASSALTPLSSACNDEEEEEEDEEAGVDCSSTTSSASPLPNSYDALEGGSFADMHSSSASSPAPDPASEPDPAPAPATIPQPSKMAKPFGYEYPTLQPGYQNAAPPLNSGAHPSILAYCGFQQYPQQYPGVNQLSSSLGGLSLQSSPQLESLRPVNLTQEREDPNQRSSTKVVQHLGPATDFYKKLALDCSGQHTTVDLFLLCSQYSHLASLACMSMYSAGCICYYPSFHCTHNSSQAEKLQKDLK
jgi:hypothetical protein